MGMRHSTAVELGQRLESLKPWYECVPMLGYFSESAHPNGARVEQRRTWAVYIYRRPDEFIPERKYVGSMHRWGDLAGWEL